MVLENKNNLNTPQNTAKSTTEGVKTLLGDPKKAIIKLAWPMIIAMSANTIYNVVDAIWVSGLGRDSIAAVGFFFPFYFIAMALATGLGVGGGAAISRKIGAKDKPGADNVGVHTFIIMVIIAILFTFLFLIFSKTIFNAIGAGDALDEVLAYSQIMFAGTIIIFFQLVSTSILRAEGDANRAMWVMMFGAGLNIVLDPIFIYTLNFGVAGAAIATVLSMAISSMVIFYWIFIKKDTFITLNFKRFRWEKNILRDISKVGIPASIMQVSMSFTMLIMNLIIVVIAGNDGIGTYTLGWRVVTVAILPLVGMATAVTSVTGASYGAKDFEKLKISFYYSIRIGLTIAIAVAIITFIFAQQITAVFTWGEDTGEIAKQMIIFLQIVCLFYPGVAFGMFSSSMFQGTGKGTNALIVTILRTVILAPPLALLFAYVFEMDLIGVWWGLVAANLMGSLIAFSWARLYLNDLKLKFRNSPDRSITIE